MINLNNLVIQLTEKLILLNAIAIIKESTRINKYSTKYKRKESPKE